MRRGSTVWSNTRRYWRLRTLNAFMDSAADTSITANLRSTNSSRCVRSSDALDISPRYPVFSCADLAPTLEAGSPADRVKTRRVKSHRAEVGNYTASRRPVRGYGAPPLKKGAGPFPGKVPATFFGFL